jgi:hypothetical protein
MSNTFNALLSRGLDSILARQLADKKLTLAKLKAMSETELTDLGLSKEASEIILSEPRPPIPTETVIKLLYESKWTCCVCRDKSKGVIIHHINEWSEAKDHSEENLVVLCSEHHDLAHAKKDLTLNLTKSRLKNIKQKWLDEVKLTDTNTIIGLASVNQSRWDYFNHNRIFELYLKQGISNRAFRTTTTVRSLGLINDLGTYSFADDDESQLYNFGDGYMLYFYMQELFNEVLKTLPLIDLTDKFVKPIINSLIKPGVAVAIQAAFYFKDQTKLTGGRGQRRICYYHKDKVKIEFEFDAYESTSNSAWAVHLRGHKVATVIGFVTSVIEVNDVLTTTISCLAMGCHIGEHSFRKEKYYS